MQERTKTPDADQFTKHRLFDLNSPARLLPVDEQPDRERAAPGLHPYIAQDVPVRLADGKLVGNRGFLL